MIYKNISTDTLRIEGKVVLPGEQIELEGTTNDCKFELVVKEEDTSKSKKGVKKIY